jgi:TolB-like protein
MTGFRKMMMIFLFTALSGALFAQIKPRLGILPFTGGDAGEGEIIALFFSNEPELSRSFIVIPRLSSLEAVLQEPQFLRSTGLTDADTITRLGRSVSADYVLTGHIRSLEEGKLLVVSLFQVEQFRQIAGTYHIYRGDEELRGMIPRIAQRLVMTSRRNAIVSPPRLAVLPIQAPPGLDQEDAELWVQLLIMEIANSGHFAVTPRAGALETVMAKQRIKRPMAEAPENIKTIGRALNVQNILVSNIRFLDEKRLYIASILKTTDASQLVGTTVNYQPISENLGFIQELEATLTSTLYPPMTPLIDPLLFRHPGFRHLVSPDLEIIGPSAALFRHIYSSP